MNPELSNPKKFQNPKNRKIRLVGSRLCFMYRQSLCEAVQCKRCGACMKEKESGYFYESGNFCSSVNRVSYLFAQAIAHRVRSGFTEFCAPCNLFSHETCVMREKGCKRHKTR